MKPGSRDMEYLVPASQPLVRQGAPHCRKPHQWTVDAVITPEGVVVVIKDLEPVCQQYPTTV